MKQSTGIVILSALGGALFFPFLSCLYLENNFVGNVVFEVSSWSVKFPGLIFTLDLDGIVWFICVKILFGVLTFFISAICWIFAIALGYLLSLFVYPFAIVKNFRNPELLNI